MKKVVNILIIDKRPMFIEGIISTLKSEKKIEFELNIEASYSYDQALEIIQEYEERDCYFNIIVTDVELNMDRSHCLDLNERLMANIKRRSPLSKLIIILNSKDNFRIFNIVRRIQPNGFLIETELNRDQLRELVNSVMKESFYYSTSIFSTISVIQKNAIHFDEIDLEILYLLSKHVKTKNLTMYIPRSLSSIEKRKQRMKDVMLLENGSDEALLRRASELQLV